jgi:hypothetical protein
MTMLHAGQKFRFRGKDSIMRAKLMAADLQGACIRKGTEIELTCKMQVTFTPLTNNTNGAGSAAGACTHQLADASAKTEPAPRIFEPPFAPQFVRP